MFWKNLYSKLVQIQNQKSSNISLFYVLGIIWFYILILTRFSNRIKIKYYFSN
jgi:hypothetical protein